MLVLTRRPGESIVVGENIVVTVIEIKGGQVRIGVDAPREVDVYREEIYEQVKQENLAAIANADRIRKAIQDSPPQ
jgi:carbon storage regulator